MPSLVLHPGKLIGTREAQAGRCGGLLQPLLAWLLALVARPSEKPILFCEALRIASKYFCSSPMVIEGLHCGVQL